MSQPYHIPVMLAEVLDALAVHPEGIYADGTLGGGGHSAAILERLSGGGKVYAFDADPGAIANAAVRFGEELGRGIVVRQAYFSEACAMLEEDGMLLDGVLLDLGISSRQIDSDQIGLSYRQEMPLDMRFRREPGRRSARDLVNKEKPEQLATILRTYGEEPAAWKIAKAIAQARLARPIETTTDLREIIEAIIPERFLMKTLSRVFQGLRIQVNDELGELREALECFVPLLKPGGRFAVLTYHSLEDRMVKDRFREEERSCICPPQLPICACDKKQRLKILSRKPVLPSDEEIERNPRARSAKLRYAERVDEK